MPLAKQFKSHFFRGLAVLLPTIVTIWILVWGYKFIQDNISIYIKEALEWLIRSIAGGEFVEEKLDKFWINVALSVAGFLIALFIVCVVGALLASVIGRTLWRAVERFIMNTPLLKQIYPYVKQITDFLITEEQQKQMFSRVVAVEYPREGLWALGFVTGNGFKKVADNVRKKFLTVLVPTSPTPFTGFVVTVPKEQVVELDMTMEEAIRFVISAGVVAPQNDKTPDFLQPAHSKS